jgi:hypothetical protein
MLKQPTMKTGQALMAYTLLLPLLLMAMIMKDDNHKLYLPYLPMVSSLIIPDTSIMLASFTFIHTLGDSSKCSLFIQMFQHLTYTKLTSMCIPLYILTVSLTTLSMANLNEY